MAQVQRVGELEISQDLAFQRRSWAVQRAGWAGMVLLLLAALLGLLGPGPLARAAAGDRAGVLWVEYHRFERYKASATLRVHLGARPWPEGKARVQVSRKYLEGLQVEQVTPQPEGVEAGADSLTYIFRVSDPNRPTAITFSLKPEQIGWHEGRVRLDGGPALDFRQVVYP